jgi:hypothetical protein
MRQMWRVCERGSSVYNIRAANRRSLELGLLVQYVHLVLETLV